MKLFRRKVIEEPVEVRGKQWMREEDDVGVKFEEDDIQSSFGGGISVMQGTDALFFQGGKLMGVLHSGFYEFEKLKDRLGIFEMKKPITVVIIDTADLYTDELIFGKFWTKENLNVNVKLSISFYISNPELFFKNFMKGKDVVKQEDIVNFLKGEISNVLSDTINKKSIEELYQSKIDFQKDITLALENYMNTSLSRMGIKLNYIRFIDFSGEEYEKIKSQYGEIYITEKEIEIAEAKTKLNQKLRGIMQQDEIDKLMKEDEMGEILTNLAKKKTLRDYELDKLVTLISYEKEKGEITHQVALDRLKHEYEIEKKRKEDEYEREKKIKDTEVALKIKKDFEKLKLDVEKERIENLSGADIVSLIAVLPSEQAERVLRHKEMMDKIQKDLKELEIKMGLTPEQMMAIEKGNASEVAKIFQAKYSSEVKEKSFSENKELLEKFMKMVEKMGENVSSRPVAGGGGGYFQQGPANKICPNCGASNPPSSNFCSNCGSRIR